MKHHVGETRNGVQVYAQLIGSPAGQRIARQPQLLSLAKEMLATVSLYDYEISMEYDMERPIGYSYTIETADKDSVFYALLLKDDVYTRFVKNGKPLSTSYLTVTLSKTSDNNYELSDVWIGRLTPPRPGSKNETAESKPYWSNHALILDSQALQLQTVTKACPY
ncbi:MAG TPA: hypothetical protein VLF91_04120 [Candidatus Saccharimonadales bacterium]|nr:hypothetical protein [Candidatus Saccharimonadales bacterium]